MPDTFSARLKACRKRAGMSQKRLARLTQIDFRSISRYERNPEKGIAWDCLCRIKRALGCSWDDLLPEE